MESCYFLWERKREKYIVIIKLGVEKEKKQIV